MALRAGVMATCAVCGCEYAKRSAGQAACSQTCAAKRKRAASRERMRRKNTALAARRSGVWALTADPYEQPDFYGYCFDGRKLNPARHAIMCPVL